MCLKKIRTKKLIPGICLISFLRGVSMLPVIGSLVAFLRASFQKAQLTITLATVLTNKNTDFVVTYTQDK